MSSTISATRRRSLSLPASASRRVRSMMRRSSLRRSAFSSREWRRERRSSWRVSLALRSCSTWLARELFLKMSFSCSSITPLILEVPIISSSRSTLIRLSSSRYSDCMYTSSSVTEPFASGVFRMGSSARCVALMVKAFRLIGTTPPRFRASPLISCSSISKRGLLASTRNSALWVRATSASLSGSLRQKVKKRWSLRMRMRSSTGSRTRRLTFSIRSKTRYIQYNTAYPPLLPELTKCRWVICIRSGPSQSYQGLICDPYLLFTDQGETIAANDGEIMGRIYAVALQFNSDQICMIAKLAQQALRRLTPILAPPALYSYAKNINPLLPKQSSKQKGFLAASQQGQAKPIAQQRVSLSLQAWQEQLRTAHSIERLKPLLEPALSHKSTHLALFLQQLNGHLTPASFQLHRAFFAEVDARVNAYTANLSLSAQEFIEIIRFRGTFRQLAGEMSFLHNFGFEKKASMLAATFLHNREFSLSQAVLALQLVVPLGGVSLLLLMNFIKYFKEVAGGAQAETIRAEHLLSLLGLKFLKRNEMIIQNTLYDHVLHYLLQNMERLMKGQALSMKVEALCTLLCFDSRNNYRTDAGTKRHWAIKLLAEMQESLDGGWASELWGETVEKPGLMAVEVAYILECIYFAKNNMLDFESLDGALAAFEGKALQQFEKRLAENHSKPLSSEARLEKFIRFTFNPSICRQWINRKSIREQVFTIILRSAITRDQTIEPLVSLINSNPEDYESKLRLLELAKAIITRQIQQGVLLQALTLTFLQRASPDIALVLIESIPQGPQDKDIQLFLGFARNCCSETPKKDDSHIQKISKFIKDIYGLALAAQSEQGYKVALGVIEDHFEAISEVLLSEDTSKANRSQMNAFLSEEAFYVSWIIFANLANGRQPTPAVASFFQRLLKNDIIKFELLSNSYQQPYPRPANFAKPVLTSARVYAFLKFLGDFFEEDKYAYFVWDILLKRLSSQPASVREECFPLVEATFLRAFRKEKMRKVVMVTVLSSHIAGGVVKGGRLKLQGLLETAIDELVVSEELIEYHYNCYLLLVSNALAADVLSPLYFDKLMLHSLRKDPKMRHTCSLMLLYGSTLRSRNEVGGLIEPKVIYEQESYLRFLIRQGHIVLPRFVRPAPTHHVPSVKREIELTGGLLAILFSFGVVEVVGIGALVAAVLAGPMEFGEWRCVANCYTPENYSLEVKREAAFRGRVNQLMIGKLILFSRLGMVSKAEETYFIDKFK